jgi:Protein of unknown function (DUF2470)
MAFNRGSAAVLEPPWARLLLDEDRLAQRARTSVAAAEAGRLVLGPLAAAHSCSYRVGVFDDDGEPRLVCRRGAVVDRAATQGRLVTLALDPTAPGELRLRLTGRLTAVNEDAVAAGRTQHRPTAHAAVVWLRVERVTVRCPHPTVGRDALRERELSLASYALAEADEFAARLPRLIGHVNRHHPDRMREVAAHHSEVPATRILAAALTGLDAHGARVTWIGTGGAQDVVIRFAEPVDTVEQLALAVRRHLGPAPSALPRPQSD